MIVRRTGSKWLLITQPAHAWLAGAMVTAWGNATLRRPEPFEAVVLAARLHDIGWIELDEAPALDGAGAPRNFVDLPLEAAGPLWRRAVTRSRLWDPFAATLVSWHATTIYEGRLARGTDDAANQLAIRALLAEQSSLRDDLRTTMVGHKRYGAWLGPEVEQDAYRWLRVGDLLSLILCSDALPAAGEIPDVPGSVPGEQIVLRYERQGRGQLRLGPWPFAAPELRLTIETRLLTQETFASTAALQQALAAAVPAPQQVCILPWS